MAQFYKGEKPIQGYEFTVRGMGQFPIDMLRYDRCWPVESPGTDGISAMMAVANPRSSRNREVYTIRLRGLSEPTDDRWKSYGWTVSDFDRIALYVNN